MDKKMILLFSGAGVAILAIIIVTVVLIVGMQNKPVNIAVTDFTTDMAYGLLEGYCNVGGEKVSKYVNSYSVSDAYKKIIEEGTDVVLASDIDQDTLNWIESSNVEVEIIPIAKDAIVFFNNTLNSVANLSINNIKDIYSGKVTNWSEIGGENLDIIAYPPKDGTEESYMLTKFMGSRTVSKPRYRIPDVTTEKVYEAVSIPIIGMGGVSSAEDVIEMMLAGATGVQVGAANLIDPYICRDIVLDLPKVMNKYNINSLKDIIGGAH